MPYTDRQIRDQYIKLQQEFREFDKATLVDVTAVTLEIDPDRVRAALAPVSVPA